MKFSKKDVIRAGKNLIDDNLVNDQEKFNSTMDVLTYWRDSHLVPLEKSNQLLNRYVHNIDKNAFIAKRIKRLDSIKRKLKRFDKMELKNMQDIGGIRLVLSSQKQLDTMLKILTNEMCFYKNNNELIKLDNYIKHPKFDGYRSIHIVGVFQNNDKDDRKIEFQLRTRLQHSWATTLEIIENYKLAAIRGNITEIKTIAKLTGIISESNTAKGVDVSESDIITQDNLNENADVISKLAAKLDTVILASGPIDILSDGETTIAIDNGDEMMPYITGSGCMLSSIVGSCIGATNPLEGTMLAALLMTIAGEKARSKVDSENAGTGSFRAYLIDYLYKLDGQTLINKSNIEIL